MLQWTAGWTLFQWWAVIGWPTSLGLAGSALLAGVLVVGLALVVWRDVRRTLGRPVPVPVPGRAAEPRPPARALAALARIIRDHRGRAGGIAAASGAGGEWDPLRLLPQCVALRQGRNG